MGSMAFRPRYAYGTGAGIQGNKGTSGGKGGGKNKPNPNNKGGNNQSGGGGGNAGSTILLLHMEGTNGSNVFTDSSTQNRSVGQGLGTFGSSTADVTISNTHAKFGSTSGKFISANNTALWVAETTALLLSGDFTIEGWFWPTAPGNSQDTLWDCGAMGTNIGHMSVYLGSGTGALIVRDVTNGTTLITGSVVSAGSFHHIALCRAGTTLSLYLDGNRDGTASSSLTLGENGGKTLLGLQNTTGTTVTNGAFDIAGGWIDEFRIVKGQAMYTGATYTVPTSAFT